MTDTFDHSGLPEDELLAAEYALGVLTGSDRLAVEQRASRDNGFARLIADWEQRLAPWGTEFSEVTPSPQVWERIAGALPATQAQTTGLWQNLNLSRGFDLYGDTHPSATRRHYRRRWSSSFRRHG